MGRLILHQRIKTWFSSVVMTSLILSLPVNWNADPSGYSVKWAQKNSFVLQNQSFVWTEVASPADFRVNSCTFTSPTNGWAVGEDRKILHWDGSDWKRIDNPPPQKFTSLYSIQMLSPNDGWIVGMGGEMLQWDGTEWRETLKVTDNDLKTISLVSSDFGFAGGKGTFAGRKPDEEIVLKWNGKQWVRVSIPPPKWKDQVGIYAIQMVSKNEGWAAGNEQLYYWNGVSWQVYPQKNGSDPLFSILFTFSAVNSKDIWAGGWDTDKDGYVGVILHWDGSEWKESYRTVPGGQVIDQIQMLSPQQGWALGHNFDYITNTQTSFLLHWDGRQWSDYPLPTSSPISAFCALDENLAWIFGEAWVRDQKGSVIRYDPIAFWGSSVSIIEFTNTPYKAQTLSSKPAPKQSSYATATITNEILVTTPKVTEQPLPTYKPTKTTDQPSTRQAAKSSITLPLIIGTVLSLILIALFINLRIRKPL